MTNARPAAARPARSVRPARLAGVVAAFAILLAACGGGSSNTTPTFTSTPDTGQGTTIAGATLPTVSTSAAATTTAASAPASATVDMVAGGSAGYSFSPSTATVAKGGSVTWSNSSNAPHTVTFSDSSIKSSGPDFISPNKTFKTSFAKSGRFSYSCTIHPGMTGTVVVS
jgi:plastocyanin